MNQKDESFKDFVLDQLRGLDDVEARRMFGGYGLYQDETFFGIVHKGRLYFKIDGSTVGEYRKHKMKPFRPNARQTLKSYYQARKRRCLLAEILRKCCEKWQRRQSRFLPKLRRTFIRKIQRQPDRHRNLCRKPRRSQHPKPAEDVYTSSAQPWDHINPELLKFAKLPCVSRPQTSNQACTLAALMGILHRQSRPAFRISRTAPELRPGLASLARGT